MSPPPVPANIVQYIEEAAKGTGLPQSVVAAQNYDESGYGTNEGPSTAGAEGPWQFLVSTFTGLGFNASGITDWSTSTQAYIKYMNELLAEEHGNVRDALAAYNAGPGNIAAGYGYADTILSEAGQGQGITVATKQSGIPTTTDTGSGILSWPGQITSFFSDADTFIKFMINPSSWLRIGAFGVATILVVIALYAFMRVGSDKPLLPSTIPVPIPV